MFHDRMAAAPPPCPGGAIAEQRGVHVLGAYHPIAMRGVFRSYPPAHTTEEVAALLRRKFGRPVVRLVVRLDRVDYGVINAVYTARLSDGLDCFVKVAPRSRGTHALRA